jgi:FkbM family methyltransferase
MFSRDDYQIKNLTFPLKESVIIDIGANIGAFTIFASDRFPDARIYAYEPAATNFEVLAKNIEINSLKNRVTAFQQAVSLRVGEETMTYSDQEYAHSLIQDQVESEHILRSEKVLCTTIPQILIDNDLQIIDLIKMDIEGLEYDLLFGLPDEIFKKIRFITLEIHDHKKYSAQDLIQFLNDRGFEIVRSKTHSKVYLATNTKLLSAE